MRQIALGQMLYTPERFGKMLIGDYLDALTGFLMGEHERLKSITETIRIAATILFNKGIETPLSPSELWPLPWDRTSDQESKEITEEENQKSLANIEFQKEFLNRMY